jgi:glycyl-tRNA synthetase beta chain
VAQRRKAGFPLGVAPPAPSRAPARARLRSRALNDFLLEIGCEEIPAGTLPAARQALAASLARGLEERQLGSAAGRSYSTPRRLAVWLRGIPARQPDRTEEVTGPPWRAAFDAAGEPTQAALGFARSQGVEVKALSKLQTPRGEYLGLRRAVRGRAAPELLQELVPEIVRGLAFPKTMRWDAQSFTFARPIRALVALWNDQVLPLELAGVRAGRVSRGHRILGRPPVRIGSPREYARALKTRGVWVEDDSRRVRILAELRRRARQSGGALLEDERTLDEASHLVEWPGVIAGRFDRAFLALPREVLLATMRHHQKYFGVVDAGGSLLPRFVAVIDQRSDPGGVIRRGNERVLRARLDDARFFWDEDRKVRLEERAARLRGILFHEKLGTLAQRVERLRALAPAVARALPGIDAASLERAAALCKLDLTAEMVRELPELQGMMGALYAREQGEHEEVAQAIYEHYRPQSLEDEAPRSPLGCALSILDRLDALAALFAAGEAPTGSRDPFALRRTGQGLVKILLDRRLHLPLEPLLEEALEAVAPQAGGDAAAARERRQALLEFVRGRVRFLLEQGGGRYDLVSAALAAAGLDPLDARLRVQALEALKQDADFVALSVSFKRIRKILAQASGDGPYDPAALRESAERELHERMSAARDRLAGLVGRRCYPEALRALAALRPPIDRFFDEVLVMAPDREVRRNRIGVLRELSRMFLSLADFAEVVVEGEGAS